MCGLNLFHMDPPLRWIGIAHAWSKRLPLHQLIPGIDEPDDGSRDISCQVDFAWGHGLLLRTSMLRDIGLFDEAFFMYFEDLDLCRRARMAGHQIWYVAEMEPGISDETVLTLANQEGAILLTADKDFGELVYRQGRIAPGIILIRLAGLSSEHKAALVTQTIAQYETEFSGTFAVLTPDTIRIRKSFQ